LLSRALIEQFFSNQYSTDQRFVILNALAIGARELASLPVPPSSSLVSKDRITFPSKQLPPALHQRLLTAADQLTSNNPVQSMLQDISRQAIDRSRDDATERTPALVRERQLRIRQPARIQQVPGPGTTTLAQRSPAYTDPTPRPKTTFTDVAVEFFIYPLINRFWLFLRDEQAREERTTHLAAQGRYHGAGTGLILNAVVLAQLLGTLAVLVHAGRNAPPWLAVVAPDALELALAMGTRRVSRWEVDQEDDVDQDGGGEAAEEGRGKSKEAAVLTAALELAVTVLDGCVDLDGGRSLGLDHTALVLGTGEWAEKVLEAIEKGHRMRGVGGGQEVRLGRAAAGVVLKTDELTSRWKRSMVDVV
jgi:telomere length regulation protein